jgi:putative endonuclease
MGKLYYVYIVASKTRSTIYIGVTDNLVRRICEHKAANSPDSFTGIYNCNRLVYYEETPYINNAIAREKQLKNWKRAWKNDLIESINPDWRDLSSEIGIDTDCLAEIAGQARNDKIN